MESIASQYKGKTYSGGSLASFLKLNTFMLVWPGWCSGGCSVCTMSVCCIVCTVCVCVSVSVCVCVCVSVCE